MSLITNKLKICNKSGFSLLELILVLGLSGVLMGSLALMCGSFIKETSPQAIDYNGNIYEIAPSLKSTMSAFDFHRTFLDFLEKSELCLCFGGTTKNDYQKHQFLPISNDFNFAKLLMLESLIQGFFLSTKSLVVSDGAIFEVFFEKMATNSDLTCILLGRNIKDSAFVQVRGFRYDLLNESYNLYSVVIYSVGTKKELQAYRYAVKSQEDTYVRNDSLKRFFYGDDDDNSRESFNSIVFPDPYALANLEEAKSGLKSLSRFTYIIDVF